MSEIEYIESTGETFEPYARPAGTLAPFELPSGAPLPDRCGHCFQTTHATADCPDRGHPWPRVRLL